MVAVVSGSGLGLFGSSLSTLGGAGAAGNATVGRGGDRAYVNSATGNLIVQSQDEVLSALGLDLALIRTYNSQGLLNDDNGDNWRLGLHQRVHGLSGTLNAADSTITKTFGDGREVTYRFHTGRSAYVGTDGDGAHDTLTNSNGTWTWTDGSGRNTETYTADGQLTTSTDADGNAITYSYTGSLLTQITDASGQTTSLTYSGNNLIQISVSSDGQIQTLTRYAYDTENRLQQVIVDLTPGDLAVPLPDANSDGFYESTAHETYITTYTYDGASRRITSITQADGSSIAFTYQLLNGEYRIHTYTDAEGRVTTLNYTQPSTTGGSGTVELSANAGALSTSDTQTVTTTYSLDESELTQPSGSGSWDSEATLESSTGATNNARAAFDANGNGFVVWTENGAVLARRYDRATNTWGTQFALDNRNNPIYTPAIDVDDAGNAIVGWVQHDGTQVSVYANYYDASTGLWSGPTLQEDSALLVENDIFSLTVALRGNRAVVAWVQSDGVAESLYVGGLWNGTWRVAEVLESGAANAAQPSVSIDSGGNVFVAWQQSDGTANSIYVNRWDEATATWSGASLLESSATFASNPQIQFDDQGNAIALWRASNNLIARRYESATASWGSEVTLDTRVTTVQGLSLSVERTSGTAIAAWIQSDGTAYSVYYSTYSPESGMWSSPASLESSDAPVATGFGNLVTYFKGANVAVAWLQSNGTTNDFVVNTLSAQSGGIWSGPLVLDTLAANASQPILALDYNGNISAVWKQSDGVADSVFTRRYTAGSVGAPYFSVHAGATWQSIAGLLYGIDSPEAGAALQTALNNPQLITGLQLFDLPALLEVTTTETITVPAYYTVQQNDTWESVTQSVYGSADASAVAAFQVAVSTPALAAGVRITVPLTLTYTSTEGSTLYLQTDVESPLGLVTTYTRDTQGWLTRTQTPAVNGTRLDTRYEYDADGNVVSITEDPDGSNRVTQFEYDENGNLELTRDAGGNTITRTYNENNQLLTETRYLVPDTDGAGAAQPSVPVTTRYVYDSGTPASESHLRFMISPEGRVIEHQYNAAGQRSASFKYTEAHYTQASFAESDLIAWASTQNATRERTDYAYDFRGNISQVTRWNRPELVDEPLPEPSVTKFVYDQRGQLLQTIEARGSAIAADPANANLPYATTYTYDGLGRVLTSTQWTSDDFTNGLSTTITQYDDANRRTVITLANNLVTTSTYNAAGELTSVIQGSNGDLGTTRYTYDDAGRLRMTTDPTGLRRFYLYDGVGRKTGEIDPDGTLTELIYNANSELIKSVQYAALIDQVTLASLVDASGNPTDVSFAAIRSAASGNAADDRISRNVYDRVGRLVYSIDGAGAVTQFFYDGAGRLTDEIRYANTVSIDRTVDELSAGAFASGGVYEINPSAEDDRHTRHFYDADGNLIGTLDGEGYLVEYEYDPGGYLFQQIAYATRTNAQYWEAGTLEDLRPEPSPPETPPEDREIRTYFFYDGQGRQIGVLDGEGFLTRTRYDVAGHIIETTRYGGSVDFETSMEFGDVVWAASREWVDYGWGYGYGGYWDDAETQTTRYEHDGAGRLIAVTDHEDTRTSYEYNSGGQLLSTTKGDEYESRTRAVRYDVLGRVIQELTGEGYARIADLQWENPVGSNWGPDWSGIGDWIVTEGDLDAYVPDDDSNSRSRFIGETAQTSKAYQRIDLGEVWYLESGDFSTGAVTMTLDWWGGTFAEENPDQPQINVYFRDADGALLSTYQSGFKDPVTTRDDAMRWDQYRETVTVPANARYMDIEMETRRNSEDYNDAAFSDIRYSFSSARTAAAIEEIWQQYSTSYDYDAAGRRISATRSPSDGQTLTTLYYYDSDSRLRFEVNPLGERVEYRYDAFGQLTDEIHYTNAISTDGLAGGLLDEFSLEALVAGADSSRDAHTSYSYSLTGQLRTTLTAEGASSSHLYNAFGELRESTQAIDADSALTHQYGYDRKGLLTETRWDPSGLNTVESRDYNAFGRLTDLTDARLNTTGFEYDRLQRERVARDPLGGERFTSYDAFGRVTSAVTPHVTTYEYDRGLVRINPILGGEGSAEIVQYFNGFGQIVGTEIDWQWTSHQYDLDGNLIETSDDIGIVEAREYDRANRQVKQIDGNGVVTTFEYDAASRLIKKTVDAEGELQLVTDYVYDGQGRLTEVIETSGRRTVTEYDRDGRIKAVTVDPNGPARSRTEYEYDLIGNRIRVTEGVGAAPRSTSFEYDTLNRMTSKTVDPIALGGTLNLVTEYKYDLNGNLTRLIDANGNSTWYVYDENNRVVQTIDALGGVTGTQYDDDGHVTSIRRHANSIATSAFGDEIALQVLPPNELDRVTRSFFDDRGNEVFTVDPLGVVTERRFDARGNVVFSRTFENAITVPDHTVLPIHVSNALEAAGNRLELPYRWEEIEWPSDRAAWFAYDVRGRLVYSADYQGAVTKRTYDGTGNVVAVTAFASPIDVLENGDIYEFEWREQDIADASRDRTTRYWYDGAGRLRFALDAAGYLTETRYLDASRQEISISYAGKPSFDEGVDLAELTLDDMEAVATATPDQVKNQETIRYFDAAGRVTQVTDADGRSEYFGYDAVGNKTSYVNKKGSGPNDTAYMWTYEYDANNRLKFERSPAVAVTTVAEVAPNGALTVSTNPSLALVTYNEYDELGNLEARTEAYGTDQARTTRYEYDLVGRQIAVVSPTIGVYDAEAGDVQWSGLDGPLPRTEVQTQIRSETAYDVFGNAFRNRVVRADQAADPNAGTFTYKAHDKLGRVTFEVDAEDQVTSYAYDSFGNQTLIKRYANELSSSLSRITSGLSEQDIRDQLLEDPEADRTIEKEYDSLNRVRIVRQPLTEHFEPGATTAAGSSFQDQPTTEYYYSDVFGGPTWKSDLVAPGVWANTRFYYDRLGRVTAEIDPNGYLSTYEYDETGDLTRKIEYADPTTPEAYEEVPDQGGLDPEDRVTSYSYDKLNRLRSETIHNVEHSTVNATGELVTGLGDRITSYGYDVLGNQTTVTDATGATAYTFYDVLGRTIAVAQPARDRGDGTTVLPYTSMLRDAHGNLVQQIEYYDGLISAPDVNAAPPAAPSGNSNRNRMTRFHVDLQGRVLRAQSATAAEQFASYNERGEIAKEWQQISVAEGEQQTVVTRYHYDGVGQLTEVVERGTRSVEDRSTRVARYNAFGEIILKYNADAPEGEWEYFDYDQAGRVWRTNSGDGVDKIYGYDAAGRSTLELRSKTIDLRSSEFGSLAELLQEMDSSELIRTETVYDLNGNVIERRMPTFEISSGRIPVSTDIKIGTFDEVTYVYWPGLLSGNAVEKFEYRLAGSSDAYAALGVFELEGGFVGANVHGLYNQTYEYRITYARAEGAVPYAESTGTFRVDGSDVGEIRVGSGPSIEATILDSADWMVMAESGFWINQNVVQLAWPPLGSQRIRVQIDYDLMQPDGSYAGGTSYAEVIANASTGATISWNRPPDQFDNRGGIYAIEKVMVYTVDENDNNVALIRATFPIGGPDTLVWNAPADPSVTAVFRYSPTGQAQWTTSGSITRAGSEFRADIGALVDAPGVYDYEIEYWSAGELIATHQGYVDTTGSEPTVTKLPAPPSATYLSVTGSAHENALTVAPTIGQAIVVEPPHANWHWEWQQGGPNNTGQYVLVPGARPWAYADPNSETKPAGFGGIYVSTLPTHDDPDGAWGQIPEEDYFYGERFAISWQGSGTPDIAAFVEYWLLTDPTNVTRVAAQRSEVGGWVADIDGVPSGQYGYRIDMRRVGALQPFAVQSGTFTRGATSSITPQPNTNASLSSVTPTIRQTVDRWGNIVEVSDAAGNVSNYRYSALNLLVQTLEAEDVVTDTRNVGPPVNSTYRVEKRNFYDLLGRLIETQDGYGNGQRVSYNDAGQVLSKRNADYARHSNATSYNVYDTFGNLIQSTDELGYRTRNKYDTAGRLTAVWREIELGTFNSADPHDVGVNNFENVQSQFFVYDSAGRRVSEMNAAYETTRYLYDHVGNIVQRTSEMGFDTYYAYDHNGRKISETDALGSTKTWDYDEFGRVLSHTELTNSNSNIGAIGGALYTYSYDEAGLLTRQTSTGGQNIHYSYDAAGNLTSITDVGLNVNRSTHYRYDEAGRRSRESVIVDGRVHQDTKINYDAHNRIRGLEDPDYRELISYDANGNRAIVQSWYINDGQHDQIINGQITYRYDEMNRVTQRVAYPAILQQTTDTTDITYNARGDRATSTSRGPLWERTIDAQGGTTYDQSLSSTLDEVEERYTYDGLGRLKHVSREIDEVRVNQFGNTTRTTEFMTTRSYTYDKANRALTESSTQLRNETWDNAVIETRATTSTYDDDGRVIEQTTRKDGEIESIVRFGTATLFGTTWTRGYDGAGNLRGYEVDVYSDGDYRYTTTYKNYYYLSEGYLEYQQTAESEGQGAPEDGDVRRYYNVNDELMRFEDLNDDRRARHFVNNAAGQVLTSIQGDFTGQELQQVWDAAVQRAASGGDGRYWSLAQHHFFVNNNLVGTIGNLQNEDGSEAFRANFDVNFTKISDSYPASVPSTVIAQGGETLRDIAARVFGDATLWYILAEENGLTDPDVPVGEGTALRVPNSIFSLSNTADSFKPFNLSDAIGDTTPTQPPPPAKDGCGVLGTVLIVIVAIVVTIFTAGAAAGAMGATGGVMSTGATVIAGGTVAGVSTAGVIGAAAIGGAVGAAASQGAAMAMGMQDEFDWKGVAIGAIGAGVTAGLGTAGVAAEAGRQGFFASAGKFLNTFGDAGTWTRTIANATISSTLTQGIAVASGAQSSFSWRDVAISAVAAPVAQSAASMAPASLGTFGRSFVAGIAGTQVRRAFGGKIDTATMIADAFGNALGNSLVDGMTPQLAHIATSGDEMSTSDDLGMRTMSRAIGSWLEGDTAGASTWANLGAINGPVGDPGADGAAFEFLVYRPDTDGQPEFTRVGSEGTHFYLTQLVAANFAGPEGVGPGTYGYDRVNNITAYSQWADENRFTDAMTYGVLIMEELAANAISPLRSLMDPLSNLARNGRVIQESIHGLNGHTVRENLDFANYLVNKYWYDDAVVGLALHLAGDSLHHVDAEGLNPTWDQIQQMSTYDGFTGHLWDTHKPDQLNNFYPNQQVYATRALAEALMQIPGLDDLDRVGVFGTSVGRGITLTAGWALDLAEGVPHVANTPDGLERAFRHAAPNFLPNRESLWNLRPETHDIPNALGVLAGTNPSMLPITYESTMAETDSFLRGVTNTRSFVDRGIGAVQIIANEYMERYRPSERPLQWTINRYRRD